MSGGLKDIFISKMSKAKRTGDLEMGEIAEDTKYNKAAYFSTIGNLHIKITLS